MRILDGLISALEFDSVVRDIRQGVFYTGVLTRNCGLAATLPRDALHQEAPLVKEPGILMEKSALELAHLAYSSSLLEAAIGMAAINSLLKIDQDVCLELNAAELIKDKGDGKKIAVVGHFPFIPRLREYAKELWVIEKNPKKGDFGEEMADKLIPQAEVVAITGSAITNHTIEHLLSLCDSRAYVILLGGSAPLSPILFDYGVNAVSGTMVIDSAVALRCVSEGANFRQIKGVVRLTMKK
ncbi:MAG: DUF364 domain-containing protein [Deltaproteobacteria bacterium]|nr:DUF364 domain-containing protein [Deltaproteobacteria bacterium]MBW1995917.1 DUF364 domain-containing protein [Deltaproteobacteria bacterium]MBW2151302.1 DUF364 domain-containing protein [Deltaproteobacteria bacterium]